MKKKPEVGPIMFMVPEMPRDRMQAIVNISNALYELSKALGSGEMSLTVRDCTINGAFGAPAINVEKTHRP